MTNRDEEWQIEATRLYDAAVGAWRGAEWTHERSPGGRWGEVIWCSGLDPDQCERCVRAAASARAAEKAGARAWSAIRAGRLAAARSAADEAARIECAYGDDPTWGPLAYYLRTRE